MGNYVNKSRWLSSTRLLEGLSKYMEIIRQKPHKIFQRGTFVCVLEKVPYPMAYTDLL